MPNNSFQTSLFEEHSYSKSKEHHTGEQISRETQENSQYVDTGLGKIVYFEKALSKKIADRLFDYLIHNEQGLPASTDWKNKIGMESEELVFTNTNWKQDHIKLYGKEIPLPRLTSWYGDLGMNYTYSGIPCEPNPWNKGLTWLKEKAEAIAEHQFNSALLNWYRDGSDTLSWHADDEKELGKNPTIASVTLGETRDFILRKKDDHSCKLKFALSHGSILIMKGELQEHWQHSVPARKRVTKSRINITFRTIY